MERPSDLDHKIETLEHEIVGLGARSVHKSYYSVSQRHLEELEMFRSLMNDIDDGFIITAERSWTVLDINGAACRFLATAADQLVGRSVIKVLPPSIGAMLVALPEKPPTAAATTGDVRTAFNATAADGTLLTISLRVRRMVRRDRAYCVLILSDITGERRTQQALAIAAARAEVANEAKSRFLAAVSHELRTPLHAVIGFATELQEMIAAGYDQETASEYLGYISDNGRQLTQMINTILEYADVDSDRYALSEERLDLAFVLMRHRTCVCAYARNGRSAQVHLPSDLPRLLADERAVHKIIEQLFKNACKHTPASASLLLGAAVDRQDRIIVFMTDDGPGFTIDDPARLTKPFETGVDARRSGASGLGLGLSMADALLRLHGGHLRIGSEPGRGTRIEAVFPAERTIR